jgi:hypothetical protein
MHFAYRIDLFPHALTHPLIVGCRQIIEAWVVEVFFSEINGNDGHRFVLSVVNDSWLSTKYFNPGHL